VNLFTVPVNDNSFEINGLSRAVNCTVGKEVCFGFQFGVGFGFCEIVIAIGNQKIIAFTESKQKHSM